MNNAATPWRQTVDPHLQAFLEERIRRHDVVGASLATLSEGRMQCAAAGVLNVETAVGVTPDTVFQIGSVGKVFTATLVAQLVDEGLVDLDVPVRRYLPDLQLAHHATAGELTLRHLLTHTSGMEGDFFPPDDQWSGSVERYVRKMALLPQLHPLGETISYCNSGYVLAGRVVEVIRRMPWQRAVMQFICQPLRMQHAYADPRESLRHRSAMGHVANPRKSGSPTMSPMTYLPLGIAPAGSVLSMSAGDLLRFVSMHMDGGASDGRQILSAALTAQMQKPHVDLPPHSRIGFNAMGLSWFLGEHPGCRVIGHDGATAGQWAYMQCLPDRKQAFVLLTNSPSTALAEEVRAHFFATVAQLPVPSEPASAETHADPSAYVGTYENMATGIEIGLDGNRLAITIASRHDETPVVHRAALTPYSPDCFQIESDNPALRGRIGFVGMESGRARYVRLGVRLLRRAG